MNASKPFESVSKNFPEKSKISASEIEQSQRHLFLCIGPDCCNSKDGEKLWEYLKKATRRLSVPVLRSKAACLRICTEGPWMVIYPEGIWYGKLTIPRLDRILQEHIIENRPVKEWIAARSRSADK